jgi:DNA-binding response OmpR family regulator
MPQSPHILIVDDTPSNTVLLSRLLTKNHFEVSGAKNGEMALAMIKNHRPHLILLDVMMPGIDGFETCRRLKADSQTQNIPVIFINTLADAVDKVKGFKVDAVDYITKPFQRQEVLVRVRTHLNLSHLQRQRQLENSIIINNCELKAKIDHMIAHGTVMIKKL